MDHTQTLMSEEMNRLVKERDECRRLAIEYTEAAESLGKKITRIQHFLANYDDVPVNIPQSAPSRTRVVKKGVYRAIRQLLEQMAPQWLTIKEIQEEIASQGFNPNSVQPYLCEIRKMGTIEQDVTEDRITRVRLSASASTGIATA